MPPKKRSRGRPRKYVSETEVHEYSPASDAENLADDYSLAETKPGKRGRKRKVEESLDDFEEPVISKTGYISGKVPKKDFLNVYEDLIDKKEPLDADFPLWKEGNSEEVFVKNFDQKVYAIINNYTYVRGNHNIFFKDFTRYPSRKFYSEYFQKIPAANCISLSDIQKRSYIKEDSNTERSEIHDYHKLLLDLDLLYKNCNYYNESHTLIVKAAYQLVFLIKTDLLSMKNDFRNYALTEDLIEKINADIMSKFEIITEKSLLSHLQHAGVVLPELQREADDELHIIEPFLDLVSETDFPDYYQVIYHPISFNMIKNNLNSGIYKSVYEFYRDMEILFMNCKTFNPPETELYSDASNLLSFARDLFSIFIKEVDALNENKGFTIVSNYEVELSGNEVDDDENSNIDFSTTDGQLQELNPEQIELIKFGGKPKLFAEYADNYTFTNEVTLKLANAATGLENGSRYNKNTDLLQSLSDSKPYKTPSSETSFSELKLTFFQDSRFSDKNVTNMNSGNFGETYSDSITMHNSLLKNKDFIQLNQIIINNDTFSKDHYYSLKNPLYGNKNFYTQIQLNLVELDLPFADDAQTAPYNYKCQVSFNNVTGGSPIIIAPKKQQQGEQSSEKSTLRCLYNIKLSEKRSLVSINIQREKNGEVDLSETVNLWFNV